MSVMYIVHQFGLLFFSLVFLKRFIFAHGSIEVTDWTLVDKYPTGGWLDNFRIVGSYSENAENDDCIFTASVGNYYCLNLTTQSLTLITTGQNVYSGAYESTALFTATETGSNDIFYMMHANDRTIIKYDTGTMTSSILGNNFGYHLSTNPCMVRHPTNTDYLFVVGLNISNGAYFHLAVYDIVNEDYVIANTLHHLHRYPNCAVMNVDSTNYFYVLGGKSTDIERINLDAVIDELETQLSTDDSVTTTITEVTLETDWESLGVNLETDDVSVDYSSVWSSSVVLIMGGRISFTVATSVIISFNVNSNEVAYVGDIPSNMGDVLAVYVVFFLFCVCYRDVLCTLPFFGVTQYVLCKNVWYA